MPINKKFLTRFRFCGKIGAASAGSKKLKIVVDNSGRTPYNIFMFWEMGPAIMKGVCIMEKAKVKKVSKKELIKQIEALGVDQKIANSLARSNIDTIVFVRDLIKSQ